MPNRHVDMNSWWRSACYPRSTFYPLSDGDSTFYRRVTKPYFRTCSTCRSRSQPTLYLYALLVITNHDEVSFGLLRYSLGGYRPSKTARLTLSTLWIHRSGVRFPISQGRYFNVDSSAPDDALSKSPGYPTHEESEAHIRVQ